MLFGFIINIEIVKNFFLANEWWAVLNWIVPQNNTSLKYYKKAEFNKTNYNQKKKISKKEMELTMPATQNMHGA